MQEELVAANAARGTDLLTALAQAKAQAQALKEKLAQMAAQGQSKATEKPPAKAGEKPESKTGEHAGEEAKKGGQLSKAQRKDLAQKAADDAQRLAEQLAARFRPGRRSVSAKISNKFKPRPAIATNWSPSWRSQPPLRINSARVTQRVSDKLEAAYQATLDAKRLFAAQREECPPQYRRLVNQYFEALSKQEK